MLHQRSDNMTHIKTPEQYSPGPWEWHEIELLAQARHSDPMRALGRKSGTQGDRLLVFRPHCRSVRLVDLDAEMERIPDTDFFRWEGAGIHLPEQYLLEFHDEYGDVYRLHDPYGFAPSIGDLDLHLFGEGQHWHAYRFLGAIPMEQHGIAGVRFAVWAPNAERVSVLGPFNRWDGRIHQMINRGASGVWELFIPGLTAGDLYKFELRNRETGQILVKTDPYARAFEMRPRNACLVAAQPQQQWGDHDWMAQRSDESWLRGPISIYEVHLGSWRRDAEGKPLGYREIAPLLADYVTEQGHTHVELLPVMEHPLDESWGYQCTGFFAPTSRYGSLEDFRFLVDHLHQRGIGVLLDWVPGHFPKDEHALARFDGTALYEYPDPRKGEHQEWGTLVFNYDRREVRCFLLTSAVYWLEEFHIDGLRVDAVASMLYLDYSRKAGEWVPNRYGGHENIEAIEFLKQLNAVCHQVAPGVMMCAEESTAWPMVTQPTWTGGLGFGLKWNMGWMNDTLSYMEQDPVHRSYHQDQLTFVQMYAHSENFILPLSHDEVVHGKRPLVNKMPGDWWQRRANLRLLFTYMWTQPGKKLLFMGGEFAQTTEWDVRQSLPWHLLELEDHRGVQRLVRDLNRIYRQEPALYLHDFDGRGFQWIDCHDHRHSVISYLRHGDDSTLAVVLNFTPIPRYRYRIGVPHGGQWLELLNSDGASYGGSDLGNGGVLQAEAEPWMGFPYSIQLAIPPLGGLILKPQ